MAWKDTVIEQVKQMNLADGGTPVKYIPVKVNKSEKPLLVIGLGGTGLRIARQTKDMFLERFKPAVRPPAALDPQLPPTTRFLAIDTDAEDIRQLGFSEAESCTIGLRELAALLAPANRQNLPKYITDWLNPSLESRGAGIDGAQGIRQIGRFDLFQNVQSVLTAIQTAIGQIRHGRGNIYVVLAAGMAGGTGAGTFLDMAYLVRYAAQMLNLGTRIRVLGYLVTPDIYTPTNPQQAPLHRANGYASMKELDYWMEAKDRQEDFTQQYSPAVSIKWEMPPFDDCVLLSSQNIAGHAPQNPYETIRGVVAEYITYMFAEEAAGADAQNAERDYGFSYSSYRSNVDSLLNAIPKAYHVSRHYTAIGAANGQVPLQELMMHEGIFLFQKVRDLMDLHADHHNEQEFANFLSAAVGQEVRNTLATIQAPDPRRSTIRQIRHSDRIAPHSPQIDRSVDTYHKSLETTALGSVMQDIINTKAINLEQALISMFVDPCRGPFYTSRFINRTPGYFQQGTDSFGDKAEGTQDLLTLLQNRKKNEEHERDQAKATYEQAITRAQPEYNTIRTAMLEPLQNGPCAQRFYTACDEANLAKKKYHEKAAMARLYALMIEKVEFLADYVIKPYLFTLEQMFRMYRETEHFIGTPVYRPKRSPYYRDIVDIERLTDNLRNTYQGETQTDTLLGELFQDMMRAYTIDSATKRPSIVPEDERWIIPDERTNHPVSLNVRDNLERVLNDFFRGYNSETKLVDFLKLQYPSHINPDGTLNVTSVMDQMMSQLTHAASPMFLPSDVYGTAGQTAKTDYITVPRDAEVIGQALGAGRDLERKIKLSAINDRIFWISALDGVSLYHYGDLLNCETDYTLHALQGAHIGTHLWEGSTRNWRNLPNPLPRVARNANYSNAIQANMDQEMIEQIESLIAAKSIVIDAAQHDLSLYFRTPDTDRLLETIKMDLTGNRIASDTAQDYLNRLLGSLRPRVIKMERSIQENYQGTEAERSRSLAYDILMQYPALVARLQEEVQVLKPVRDELDRIIHRDTQLDRLLKQAPRTADLLTFGVLRSPNRMHYQYEYETGHPQIFYNTMTDNATYAAKYNAAYGLECGIADKLAATSQGSHPDHGMYAQLAELEQALADDLAGVDHARLGHLRDVFAELAPELKKKLRNDVSTLQPRQARELGMDAANKAFLIDFKQAMIKQIDDRAVSFGIIA